MNVSSLPGVTRSSEERLSRGWRRRLVVPFKGDPISQGAMAILALLMLAAVAQPLLPLGSATTLGVGPRLGEPSLRFIFGTDALGRPMLPRVVDGLRSTFALGFVAVALTTFWGTSIGLVAGYRRGLVDAVVSRLMDLVFAFPALLLALLIVTVLGPGDRAIVLSIVIFTTPLMVRVVRGAAIQVAHRDFVRSAEISGASTLRILLVHLLPNVAGAVAVQATYALSVSMLIESGLSFLGLGVQPPGTSLGSLVHDGSQYLTVNPWLTFIPGLCLGLTILSVNLIGDGIRDRLQPRVGQSL